MYVQFTSCVCWVGGLKNFFGVGGRCERGGQFLEGGRSGLLEIAIVSFTSRLLFDVLFTCRLKDAVSLVIFHYVFTLFRVLLKVFFTSVLFNSLLKKKSV